MDFKLVSPPQMNYVLYDLSEDPTLAGIHLPKSFDLGPVLLLVKTLEQYSEVYYDLKEMCLNEGDEWMTTLLFRDEQALDMTCDLEPNVFYIMITHYDLFDADPNQFLENLQTMQKLVFN